MDDISYINNNISNTLGLFNFGVKDKAEVLKMNMQTLAFIGDAVHALFVKEHFALNADYKKGDLQILVAKVVRAQKQADALNIFLSGEADADSLDVVRRAKNTKTNNIPKNASVQQYHEATAYEALVGFYYLTGQKELLLKLLNSTL